MKTVKKTKGFLLVKLKSSRLITGFVTRLRVPLVEQELPTPPEHLSLPPPPPSGF